MDQVSQKESIAPRQVKGEDFGIIFPSDQSILLALSEINKNYDDFINQRLSTDDLKRLFLMLWKGPQKKFINKCSVDRENFNKFLAKGTAINECENAVINFMAESLGVRVDRRQKPAIPDRLVLGKFSDAVEKCADYRRVFLVDTDNRPSIVDKLYSMNDIYVICHMRKGMSADYLVNWRSRSNICVFETKTIVKDAADIGIISMATAIAVTRSSVELYIVTSDRFAEELSILLEKEYDVRCSVINPRARNINLYFDLVDFGDFRHKRRRKMRCFTVIRRVEK